MTEQLLVPVAGRLQLRLSKLPASPAPLLKLTVPVGRIAVPLALASLTVAVQTEPWLITTEAGEQVTLVELSRLVAVTVSLPLLPVWLLSPP